MRSSQGSNRGRSTGCQGRFSTAARAIASTVASSSSSSVPADSTSRLSGESARASRMGWLIRRGASTKMGNVSASLAAEAAPLGRLGCSSAEGWEVGDGAG